MEIEKYSPKWLLEKINNSKNDAHKLMHIIEYSKEIIKSTDQQLILSGVVKSLPTKEEINLAANECSDINEIICEDEYWVIAKNDGFQEGADFVINKLK